MATPLQHRTVKCEIGLQFVTQTDIRTWYNCVTNVTKISILQISQQFSHLLNKQHHYCECQ